MQHPYEVLKQENAALLAAAYILPARRAEALSVGNRLLAKGRGQYEGVQMETHVPVVVTAAIHERECSGNFKCALCNGEQIIGTGERTTLVPRGRGPYETFAEGAEDALHLDGLDKVASTIGWTQESAAYKWEGFNGFGPRDHGRHSGYVWAGTNIYDGGKYVADGKWDPNFKDPQLGCVAIMLAIAEISPALALPRALPAVTAHTVVPTPQAVPDGHGTPEMSASAIQEALNTLGCHPPLLVDGSMGRISAMAVKGFQRWKGLEVDGLVGPKTRAAFQTALAELHH